MDEIYGAIRLPSAALRIREVLETALSDVWSDFSDAAQQDDGTVILTEPQASGGEFQRLETVLRRLRIAFDRHTDGRDEYSAEITFYRPDQRGRRRTTTMTSDNDTPMGHEYVPVDLIRKMAGKGTVLNIEALLRRAGVPDQSIGAWAYANRERLERLAKRDPADPEAVARWLDGTGVPAANA